MSLDMSSLASIRAFASSLAALVDSGTLPRIRALICAAAVMQVGGKRVTGDDMEATCQVNYLANFLLVLLLLPFMRMDCRIIFLTSNLILDEGDFRGSRVPDPVVEEMGRSKAFSEGTARYAISKVLLSMFAAELQRRLNASTDFGGIRVVLLDPGTFVSGMLDGRS
jgi:NAD(P)-dependent dehydrogenase (short-subunit alcohol dehydrogenase family)